MPKCPEGQVFDAKMKECRDKKKPGRKPVIKAKSPSPVRSPSPVKKAKSPSPVRSPSPVKKGKCPEGQVKDKVTKECRDKVKRGRKTKEVVRGRSPSPMRSSSPKAKSPSPKVRSASPMRSSSSKSVGSKYTAEILREKSYDVVLNIHKKMVESGKIVLRKGMKKDKEHLIERIVRKQ